MTDIRRVIGQIEIESQLDADSVGSEECVKRKMIHFLRQKRMRREKTL